MLKRLLLYVLLSGLLGTSIGIGSDRKDCPVNNCNTREEVIEIVDIFNRYIVSKRLGFIFECKNPESDTPVLRCYTGLNKEYCLKNEDKFRWIAGSISIDWSIYTGNKEVGMFDGKGCLVFRINEKGKFFVVGEML